jgi:hypothetical protein
MKRAAEIDPSRAAVIALENPQLVIGSTPSVVAAALLKNVSAEAALQFSAQLPEAARSQATSNTIRNWVQRAPESVEKWALAQSDEEVRKMALKSLARYRLEREPGTVTKWISGLPSSSGRDAAIREAVSHRKLTYDERATLVTRAEDTITIREAFIQTIRNLVASHDADARAWSERTIFLSPEEKATILRSP